MNHWVMDYETLSDCFIAVFEHYKEQTRRVFVIHRFSPKSQFEEFIEFIQQNLEKDEWHISYNGLAFDAQITHYILENYKDWEYYTNDEIAKIIYKYAQYVINGQEERRADYPEWKMFINQIDLFKMNHWDNAAKRSSLKWIQYSMDWENVEDMPHHHTESVDTIEKLETIIRYCINDVQSTKKVFEASKEQIELRKSLSEEYGINLFSASETRIAKELFAHFLSKNLGIPKHEVKKMKTERDVVYLGECIFPYISFETPEFQKLLEFFKGKVIKETKGSINHMVHYKGIDIYYGLGGIHGAKEGGVYEALDGYTIMTSDVTSFYPNLAIRNQLSPGHFPQEAFCTQYEWFFDERKKIPKADPKNYVYKIILNSTYGLSNDENSFLYDPNCKYCTSNVFVQDAIEAQDTIDQDRAILTELERRFDELETEIESVSIYQVQYDELTQYSQTIRTTATNIERKELQLQLAESELQTRESELETVLERQESFTKNETAISHNKRIDLKITLCKDDIEMFTEEIKSIQEQIKSLFGAIEVAKTNRGTALRNLESYQQLETEYKAYEYYLAAVQRNGIPYELVAKALPKIEAEINNVLNQIVDFNMVMNSDGKNINGYIIYDEDNFWPLEL